MEDAPETPHVVMSPEESCTPADKTVDPPYLLRGSFALYDTPSGGIHLVWRADGEEEMHHVDVPAFAVNMAQIQMAGKGGGLMGKLMGKMGGVR